MMFWLVVVVLLLVSCCSNVVSSSCTPSSSPVLMLSPSRRRLMEQSRDYHDPSRRQHYSSDNARTTTLSQASLASCRRRKVWNIRGGGSAASKSSPSTKTSAAASSTRASFLMIGLKNSLASSLAAACSKTILAPFDTIKTMQQYYFKSSGQSLSLVQVTRMILERPAGFYELYAGLGVAVVGAMPSVGLYFGVYSYCKRVLVPYLQDKSHQYQLPVSEKVIWTTSIAASAAIGNTVASFSRVPYEVVKQKLQTGMYDTTWHAIRDMASTNGWRAFFPMGGVSIQMWRDIPYAIVTLLSYEQLRESFVKPYKERNPDSSSWCDMVAGAVAGGIGSYVTNPMDVVKTRIQTNPKLYGGSISKCARMTFQEGGAMAFLRGSVPRLLHKIPANGFFFLFYEFFGRLLQVDTVEEV